MEGKKVIVIGGGASGLTAAIFAARAGAKVTLLEQNEKPGKKICATGNGKCNLTNQYQDASCYRGENPSFAQKVFSSFSLDDTLQFFREIGIVCKDKNGYYYPRSEQASSVVELLLREAAKYKVKIKTKEKVTEIHSFEGGYQVVTETWHYEGDCVIVASGSCASSISGADGSGYILAKKLGHTVKEPLPALVSLRCEGRKFARWAGVRTEGRITLLVDGKQVCSERGELQLTEYGVSGIPVFQISHYAVRAAAKQKEVVVQIHFLPEFSEAEVEMFLKEREQDYGTSAKEMLLGVFPEKLISVLKDEKNLIEAITRYSLKVKGPHSMESAQVCSGGVLTEELDAQSMESLRMSGIYFTGELVDIDGACGGYNLQWAWSSGAIAGKHAGK